MTSTLLIGDIHLSDRPPASCTDTYLDDLFDLLDHAMAKAFTLEVDAVISVGDVFHHRQPNRTSHSTVQRMIEVIKQCPVPFLIVPGNHDYANGDRFDSIFETQPLGTLLRSGAELLDGWHNGPEPLPVYGIPWQQEFTSETVESRLEGYRSLYKAGEDTLVIAHAPLYPKGLELPYEFYLTEDWAASMGNRGDCYYGHVHDSHGIYEESGVTFANHGALSRGSLAESDLTRKIRVTLWEQGIGFTPIDLPHKPASEVFRIKEIRDQQAATALLDNFLGSVKETSLEITSIDSVMKHVREILVEGEPLNQETLTTIESLLVDAS